jgi:hypothetical protein
MLGQRKQREARGTEAAMDLSLSNTVVTPRDLTEKELGEVSGGVNFKFSTSGHDKVDTHYAF